MSSAPLMRVRRDTPYGAPPPAYGAPAPRGRVGPVYTFVKTDPQVTIQYIDELFIQKRRQRSSLLFRGPLPSLVYKYFCYAVVAQKDTNCTGFKFKLIVYYLALQHNICHKLYSTNNKKNKQIFFHTVVLVARTILFVFLNTIFKLLRNFRENICILLYVY